ATAGEGVESPTGTTGRLAVGPYLLFTGPSPAWALARDVDELDGAADLPIHVLDPYRALEPPTADAEYAATVSSMSRNGRIAMVSTQAAERRVILHDTDSGEWGATAIASPPESAAGLQLSFVGDRWVLFAAAGGGASRLWVEGRDEPF